MMKQNTAKKWGISSFALHLIAMGLMLSDHLWGTFLANYPVFGYLGRLAFPIFAFMLVEGFLHTGDRKRYAGRMLVFALISEIPFNLLMEHRFFYPLHQNVLFTFLIAIGMMTLFEMIGKKKNIFLRVLLYALAVLAGFLGGFLTFADYFGHGILMVALFCFTRIDPAMNPGRKVILALLQAAGMYWINCEMMMGMMIPITLFGTEVLVYKQGFALLSLPIIWLYNGEQGLYNKAVKGLYYWFYPLHMLLLGLLITLL